MNDLKELLKRYLKRLNPGARSFDIENTYITDIIFKAYNQKHRKYHNLTHIMNCLYEFEEVKPFLNDPDSVELAIWFHDIVYNRFSNKNEENSALIAKNLLGHSVAIYLYPLILSTKPGYTTMELDDSYMQDIDNSILGTNPSLFKSYDENIREEYKIIPGFIFNKRRLKFLNSLLCKDSIYNTDYFQKKYEKQARINIAHQVKYYIDKL